MNRREFMQTALGAAVLTVDTARAADTPQRQRPAPMIGIQVGAASFVDEGIDPVLDRFQRDAHINGLFIATFSYGRGIDRKSTRLNSSHRTISYAVFCLKKKKKKTKSIFLISMNTTNILIC